MQVQASGETSAPLYALQDLRASLADRCRVGTVLSRGALDHFERFVDASGIRKRLREIVHDDDRIRMPRKRLSQNRLGPVELAERVVRIRKPDACAELIRPALEIGRVGLGGRARLAGFLQGDDGI